MFMGKDERKAEKPECISPHTARQCARAARSAGNKTALGLTSFRYSPIAKVSHTWTPSWSSAGTIMDADSNSISAFMAGSSAGITCSSKSSLAKRAMSQPRKAQAP